MLPRPRHTEEFPFLTLLFPQIFMRDFGRAVNKNKTHTQIKSIHFHILLNSTPCTMSQRYCLSHTYIFRVWFLYLYVHLNIFLSVYFYRLFFSRKWEEAHTKKKCWSHKNIRALIKPTRFLLLLLFFCFVFYCKVVKR